ncbi:hypothetical protein EJ110_NYTH15915 [Nymphaea thermarum]|nr:hypothetical protein EJ110_NYTH15915 [Nymphaea thermarum]
MDVSPFKASKRSLFALRMVLLFFAMTFGVYICSICLKQISTRITPQYVLLPKLEMTERNCKIPDVPTEDLLYVHYPQPKTYSRGECECSPVRFFVILSMQRSGSGWFETLLNSHPNVSSNGEIFSVKERRENFSTIERTLDRVYNLEWVSSAAKNDCVAAVGFKWMLNQAAMEYHREIVTYFNRRGVLVIFLFRQNLLRRLISVLANAYDREKKLLNGTHKSHVHSEKEAEVLAMYRPVINTANLLTKLKNVEKVMEDSLKFFNSTRHILLYYEKLINNQDLSAVQKFLGVPVRKLKSRQVKIHTRPPSEQIDNWGDVHRTLRGTEYEHFLSHADHIT